MNDIEILREMLIADAIVPLQHGQITVELTDTQSKTTITIKGIPPDSIVIRAEEFEAPRYIFNNVQDVHKRADFVIVSNDTKKWMICIETQAGDYKRPAHVRAQLKGALCFMRYCQCIGKKFWKAKDFLDGYEYRFISMVNIPTKKPSIKKGATRFYKSSISSGSLHKHPENFLKISGASSLHFSILINKAS